MDDLDQQIMDNFARMDRDHADHADLDSQINANFEKMNRASGAPSDDASTAPDYLSHSWVHNAAVGALQGAASFGHTALNALDAPAQFLENHFGTLGGPTVAQARGNRDLENWNYQQNYGGSPAAMVGNVAASTAMTAPVLAVGGEALGANPMIAGTMSKLRGAGLLGRMSAGAITGSGQGAAAAAMTSGGYNNPFLDQVESGTELGGALGGAAPAVGKGISTAWSGLTGNSGVSPAVADLAEQAVQKFGIPIRGSQITSSPFVRYLDSVLGKTPLSGMAKSDSDIATSFNRAIADTIGAPSDSLTPDVVAAAKKAIGAKFDAVASQVPNVADVGLGNDLLALRQQLPLATTADKAAPVARNVDQIFGLIGNNGGTLSGEQYRAITQNGSTLDKLMDNADPTISDFAHQIRGALDNALQRNSPQQLKDLLTDAKYRWKNYITLKPLIEKADANGHVSPALLLNRVRQVWDNVDTGGGGDLGALAKIGQQFLKQPPESGTAPRESINRLLGGAGTVGASVLGLENPHAVLPALGAGALTLGIGRGASAAIRSNWYRNMLLNPAPGASPAAANMLVGEVGIPLAINEQRSPINRPLANAR